MDPFVSVQVCRGLVFIPDLNFAGKPSHSSDSREFFEMSAQIYSGVSPVNRPP